MSHPVLHLVGFYLRSRMIRSICLICLIASAGLVGSFQTAAALRLDGPQQAALHLGNAQYAVEVPTPSESVGELLGTEEDLTAAVVDAGGTVASMGQKVSFLDLDGTPEQVTLWEGHWSDVPFPERFALTEGRWPVSTEEVVVQDTLTDWYQVGDRLSMFSGGVEFTVVGTVHDDFQRNGALLLTSPEGWDRVVQRVEGDTARYDMDDVRTEVRWEGGDASAVQSSLSASSGGAEATSGELTSSLVAREDFLAMPPPGLATVPALIGYVPLTVVPVAIGGIGAMLMARIIRRSRDSMWRIGVDSRTSAGAGWLAVLAAVVAGSLLGGLLGAGLAWALRPAVNLISNQALSSFADPAAPILLVLTTGAVGATFALLAGGLFRRPAGAARSQNEAGERSPRKTLVDTVIILAVVVTSALLSWGALTAAQGLASTAAATRTIVVLCVALALVAGLLVRAAWALPTKRPVPALAFRRLRRTATSSMVTAIALALAASVPVALATTTATEADVENQSVVSAVPPSQIDLGYSTASGRGLPGTVLQQFEQHTGLSNPVMLRTVLAGADSMNGEPPAINGLPTAVATAADLERVLERSLTEEERQGFAEGKILTTKPVEVDQVQLSSMADAATSFGILPLSQVPPEYREATAGFVASTSVDELPMDAGYYVYTGLVPEQVERARAAAVELGFDPSWVRSHEQPVMFRTPTSWVIMSWVLVAVVVLVAASLARAQARGVQPYVGSLYAVGVAPSMLRRVVLAQMVMLVGLPVASGIFVGVMAAAGVWALFPEPATVTVPWPIVGVAAAGCVSAVVLGTLPGAARLTARARFAD